MVAHHIAMMPVLTRVAFLVLVFGCVSVPVRAQMRLADASDRAAFRSWFVLLADAQFERPVPEVTDCAALIRFAFREALRAHTPEWARRVSLPVAPPFPDVRSAPTPDEGGWPLFRVSPGTPGRYAEFADARTLVRLNARRVSRDTSALQPAPDPIVITAPGREGVNSVRLVKAGGGTLYWSSRASFYDTQGAQTRSGSRQTGH